MSIKSRFKLFFLWLIRAYRLVVSSCTAPSCRFYPTCSHYAEQALHQYGVRLGLWLTLKRLAKCHPWGPFGIDYVPESGASSPTALPESSRVN